MVCIVLSYSSCTHSDSNHLDSSALKHKLQIIFTLFLLNLLHLSLHIILVECLCDTVTSNFRPNTSTKKVSSLLELTFLSPSAQFMVLDALDAETVIFLYHSTIVAFALCT